MASLSEADGNLQSDENHGENPEDVGIGSASSTYKHSANIWNVYSLGIVMVIDGLFVQWNNGLHHGFCTYIIGLGVIIIAFSILSECAAELTSALPFSGGMYGYSRVTLGPAFGYLLGICDALRNVMLVARSVWRFGLVLEDCIGSSRSLLPLLWALFFLPSLVLDHCRSEMFWAVLSVAAIATFILLALYLLAASPEMNFADNALQNPVLTSSFEGFLSTLRPALGNFSGLLMLSLCCSEAVEPKKTVPRAIVTVTRTMAFLSIIIAIACSSVAPGASTELADAVAPLSFGFAKAFGISPRAANLFSLLPSYVTSFGFIYAYSRLLCAMAQSRLLPDFLGLVRGDREAPYSAQLVGNLFAFAAMLVSFFSASNVDSLGNAGFLATILIYLGVLSSFVIFRTRYPSLSRHHRSPYGVPGAILAALIFIVLLISLFVLEKHIAAPLALFLGVILAAMVYYFLVAARRQSYSRDEQNVLLVVYVMKNNQRKRRGLAKAVPRVHIARPKPSGVPVATAATAEAVTDGKKAELTITRGSNSGSASDGLSYRRANANDPSKVVPCD